MLFAFELIIIIWKKNFYYNKCADASQLITPASALFFAYIFDKIEYTYVIYPILSKKYIKYKAETHVVSCET